MKCLSFCTFLRYVDSPHTKKSRVDARHSISGSPLFSFQVTMKCNNLLSQDLSVGVGGGMCVGVVVVVCYMHAPTWFELCYSGSSKGCPCTSVDPTDHN